MEYDYKQLAEFVVTNHAGVNELFVCKGEWKNAVGTYFGSKDSILSGELSGVCHVSPVGINEEVVLCKITYVASCAVKLCVLKFTDCNDYLL